MSKKIFKWSQGLFHKQFWTTQHICQFEILSNFLYDTVQEDDSDYPSCLTWIDNVIHGDDDDLYAIRLLFVLTCSKRVRDATLRLLEEFVNSPMFNVDYVLQLGENDLSKEIQHLGMGNKNTSNIIVMFKEIKKYMEECGHFARMMSKLMQYHRVGMKIASLVLYFAYGQNNVIPVDLHVIKCAIALQWVPEYCKLLEAV